VTDWHPDIPLEYRNQIVTGDARQLAEAIPDESIDLIFTDPVYDRIEDYEWLAETAARVLKPRGSALIWQGVKWMPQTMTALNKYLIYRWTFSMSHLNACVGTIKGHVYSHWTPCFWYSKANDSVPAKRVRDAFDVPLISKQSENHKWHKSIKGLYYWCRLFSEADATIFDPFTGGGTVPAVCKMLQRNYIAFEIDPTTADLARERVRNTQPPLLVPQHEQLELAV